jgi:cytochrome b561
LARGHRPFRAAALDENPIEEASMQDGPAQQVYNRPARMFHWLTAGFVFVMIPVGVIMSDRGDRNIWDGTTNALYSGHKLAGFILLILMVARLAWRLVKGAPPPDASIEPWQRTVSALNHWGLYILLFAMALTGWLGVSLFPALDIFGLFSLPALTSPDQAAAGRALFAHKLIGFALVAFIVMHVGAALHHHFIRKDGVLRRMLPKRG